MSLDRRRHAFRDDLAAASLRGKVDAPRFVEPVSASVAVPLARCYKHPEEGAIETEFLFGELIDVYEDANGWSFVQARRDRYTGYVETSALASPGAIPTHRIGVPLALVFTAPSIRAPLRPPLPMNAAVHVTQTLSGKETFHQLAGADPAFVLDQHLSRGAADDFVAVAEQYVGAPYLWGGKSWHGLDCSALVQLALEATGRASPRDSDMQEAEVGILLDREAPPERGDIMFWRGHLGVMLDRDRLLHANGHHMACAVEPLETAVERLANQGLEVVCHKRLA